MVPLSLALSEAAPGDPEWDMIRRYKNPDYVELWWVTMHRYMLQPLNLIDLVAIIPFYVKLLGGSGSSLSIIRILRLARVVRLIRSGRGGFSKGLLILSNTLVSSAPMNAFLFCVALVIFVVCGSIGYLIEGGEFTVTEDYPEGVYMRPNLLGTHLEPSPFISVLHGIYWSVVTSTTVGYGDMYPTTWAGRVFACACTFLGIVVIALPVTVLGNHFGKEYEREYIGQNANDAENAGDILPSDTNSVEALPDNTDLGSDIRQDGLELASCHLASSNSTCRKIIVGRKPLDAADVESAAKSVRRLEDMANELQLVIRTMKDELEIHRANLNRQSSPPPFDSDSIGLKEGIQMQR